MQEKSAVIFQFAVMIVLTIGLFYGFYIQQQFNEIILGALIGSFMGLPQAFNTERKV